MKYTEDEINGVFRKSVFAEAKKKEDEPKVETLETPTETEVPEAPAEEPQKEKSSRKDEPDLPEFKDKPEDVEFRKLSFKSGGRKIDVDLESEHLYIDDDVIVNLEGDDLKAIIKLIGKLVKE